MASRSLGTLTVDLVAKIGGFTAGMSKAERETQRSTRAMERRLKETTAAAKKFGVALGAAFVAAGTAAAVAIKSAIDNADELSKAAQKIGISTESLSKLGYAAQLADVDLTTLQGGLARLTKFQDEAAKGTEKNVSLFEDLGIAFKNADGTLRSTDAVFRDLAEVFQALPDGANKTALALEVFGRSGANLIPLLNSGADGLDMMADRAERLGIVVDTQTGKAAEEFNDRLSDLRLQVEGLALAVAAELLPDLNNLVGTLQDGTEKGEGFAGTAKNIANGIRGVVFVASKGYDAINGIVLALADLTLGAAEFATKFGPAGAILKLDGGENQQKIADLRAILQARAKEAEDSFLGREAERVGTGGATGITGTGIRGGRGRAEGETSRADMAAQERYNQILNARRTATEATASATSGLAKAEREAADAAKAAADARVAQLDQFLELVDLREKEREQVAEDAKAMADAKAVVDQTLADIAFETKLLGLNNLEREKAIALRYANVDAASAEGQAIGAALAELENAQQVAEAMDVVRGATEGLFSDLIDGSKSAKDAFRDFVDNILDGIGQIVARNLTESLFGSFGSADGGASGGFLTSLFGSLFGGGRASGGPVSGNRIYEVGEGNRPELLNSGGRKYLIPGNNGQVTPMGSGRGGSTTINFVLPGRNDIRTEAQRQSDLARTTQRQLQRGTA